MMKLWNLDKRNQWIRHQMKKMMGMTAGICYCYI